MDKSFRSPFFLPGNPRDMLIDMIEKIPALKPYISLERNLLQTYVENRTMKMLYNVIHHGHPIPEGAWASLGGGKNFFGAFALRYLVRHKLFPGFEELEKFYMVDLNEGNVKDAIKVADILANAYGRPDYRSKFVIEQANLAEFDPFFSHPFIRDNSMQGYHIIREKLAFMECNQCMHWMSYEERSRFLKSLRQASLEGALLAFNISAIGMGMPLIPAYIKTVMEMGEYHPTDNPGGYDPELFKKMNNNPVGSVTKKSIESQLINCGWEILDLRTNPTGVNFDHPFHYFIAAKTYGSDTFLRVFPNRANNGLMKLFWNKFIDNYTLMLVTGPRPEYRQYCHKDVKDEDFNWQIWGRGPWAYKQMDHIGIVTPNPYLPKYNLKLKSNVKLLKTQVIWQRD